jgi:3',5'-cyclic AMP phosphodiesterase CpdA
VTQRARTIAHLSDLHLGRSAEWDRAALALRDAVAGGAIDQVVVTGDVTNRGRLSELEQWESTFGPLERDGRLTVVPGNHDRLGDDVGAAIMRGGRVEARTFDGLYLVRVDSTGPHNRFLLAGHGDVSEEIIEQVALALEAAPRKHLVVLMLHHHLLPLPEETFPERISSRLGWPWALELRLGLALLSRIRGRCDLVLHGHRHVPRGMTLFAGDARPIGLFNAGCSTELGRFRLFTHVDGRLTHRPIWVDVAHDEVHELPSLEAVGR